MNEDFVDFNLAKKLKDLGFNEPFFFFYREDDKEKYVHHASISKPLIYCDKIDNEVIIAPTISQVLKWLREEHATHIEISLGRNGWYFEIIQYEYYEEENEYDCKLITVSVINDSYEESAIAGIEYTLYNLI